MIDLPPRPPRPAVEVKDVSPLEQALSYRAKIKESLDKRGMPRLKGDKSWLSPKGWK